MQGIMLNELETQDIFMFEDPDIWENYPPGTTASAFLKTNALTKEAGCRICVGVKNDRYEILKNMNDQSTRHWSGTLAELHDLLKDKKEWFSAKTKPIESMIVAGKYKERYIIMRCCKKGDWYITQPMHGSGAWYCTHQGVSGNYDYMNVSELKEVTNKKIIKQAELSNPYELKWQDSV
jgi:hypothetical protein